MKICRRQPRNLTRYDPIWSYNFHLNGKSPSSSILSFFEYHNRSIMLFESITRPMTWLSAVSYYSNFINALRSSRFSPSVAQKFLVSSSAIIINPRQHRQAGDTISLQLPSSSLSGLDDEAVLALFTKGFFGGRVFSIERVILSAGGWKWLPARYTGTLSLFPNHAQCDRSQG